MAMYKKWISILCALLLAAGTLAGVCVAGADTETKAVTGARVSVEEIAGALKTLGLFRGVSDTEFDLDRAPTRVEAVVMLVRLLGAETAAAELHYSHPFTDVPDWADPYIGYAYHKGYVKGISADTFGTDAVTGAMYFTFVLRSLGYTEGADGDFTWDEPFAAAADAGIADETLSVDAFTRGDVVKISWYALHATKKDSDVTLAKELTDAGAITEKAMARADTVLVDVPFQKVTWNGQTRRFAAVQTMDDDGSETLPSVDESEPIDVPTDPTITDR